MQVRDWMTERVATATPDTPVSKARAIMEAKRCRHLPILDGPRLIGIVSDRDLGQRSATASCFETVATIMRSQLLVADPSDELERAAGKLYVHRIGCLPVVEDGRLCGILTTTDVFRAMVEIFGFREPGSRFTFDCGRHGDALWDQLHEIEHGGLRVSNLVLYRPDHDAPLRALVRAQPQQDAGAGLTTRSRP